MSKSAFSSLNNIPKTPEDIRCTGAAAVRFTAVRFTAVRFTVVVLLLGNPRISAKALRLTPRIDTNLRDLK
jgi:hypothetical protein